MVERILTILERKKIELGKIVRNQEKELEKLQKELEKKGKKG